MTIVDQDQPSLSHVEAMPNDYQVHPSNQYEGSNDQDDQVIPPLSNEKIEARRLAKASRTMEIRQHYLNRV
jgi:hypothetical protein